MLEAAWGKARRAVASAISDASAARVVERIWRRDASLWSDDPTVQATIANRLGWLEAPDWSYARIDELAAFQGETSGSMRVLLFGMGGSSLAPEVLYRVYHAAAAESEVPGRAQWQTELAVLDSTDPDEVLAAERRMHPSRTLFVVASKSGETIETRSHAAYFLERSGAPERFVAVTDPGSPLSTLASERGFRRAFLNPADIGGRYSALSYFGLVPATAVGIHSKPLLDAAREMVELCRRSADNPGLELGVALAELARRGRDKVTFVASPGLEAFGAWAEQLVAESTGKHGLGLVPVDGEPLGAPSVYGEDRVFVHLRLAGSGAYGDALGALAKAGHPVVALDVASADDLGAQFFLWEFATAVAGWRLGINPFDEPNVSESKQNTARLIDAYTRNGAIPGPEPVALENGVLLYDPVASESVVSSLDSLIDDAKPGRYLALLGFVPRNHATEEVFRRIRTEIRDHTRVATTAGFGPRYLHSTGQLHKGGPDTGLFIQITTEHSGDAQIPERPYTFGVLQAAQAAGDFEALAGRGLRVIRLHLAEGVERGLRAVGDLVHEALRS